MSMYSFFDCDPFGTNLFVLSQFASKKCSPKRKELLMPKKTYSCVNRTKHSFETALATLSKTTPLPKITVKALCEEAWRV